MFGIEKSAKADGKENKKGETKIKRNKILKGVVTSDKMDKTVTVLVKRFVKHPKYKKFVTITKKYKAHDADNQNKEGDSVQIEATRPISKDKRFKVIGK